MGQGWKSLLEAGCFQWDGFALNYDVLCMGAANGDLRVEARIVPHLNRRICRVIVETLAHVGEELFSRTCAEAPAYWLMTTETAAV